MRRRWDGFAAVDGIAEFNRKNAAAAGSRRPRIRSVYFGFAQKNS
jgi:hypothetical protein